MDCYHIHEASNGTRLDARPGDVCPGSPAWVVHQGNGVVRRSPIPGRTVRSVKTRSHVADTDLDRDVHVGAGHHVPGTVERL